MMYDKKMYPKMYSLILYGLHPKYLSNYCIHSGILFNKHFLFKSSKREAFSRVISFILFHVYVCANGFTLHVLISVLSYSFRLLISPTTFNFVYANRYTTLPALKLELCFLLLTVSISFSFQFAWTCWMYESSEKQKRFTWFDMGNDKRKHDCKN